MSYTVNYIEELVTILTHTPVILLGENHRLIMYIHIILRWDFRIGYDILSSVLDLNNL
jgi:hypothetical protein